MQLKTFTLYIVITNLIKPIFIINTTKTVHTISTPLWHNRLLKITLFIKRS